MAKISEIFIIRQDPGVGKNMRNVARFELTAIGDGGAQLSVIDGDGNEAYQIGGNRIDAKTLQLLEDKFREMRFWLEEAHKHLNSRTNDLEKMPLPEQ